MYGQPIVVGGLAVAATESDTVYGLDLATGAVRWRTHLGTPVPASDLPCGNIDPLGITGTPAYDPSTGSVFVVAETTGGRHTLVALDATTGRERWHQSLDVTRRDRLAEQQRGALAVANGRVYVPFGGLFGDCGDYVGYVTATPVGGGTTTTYAVPTSREGGIWAASGVAVDTRGDVLGRGRQRREHRGRVRRQRLGAPAGSGPVAPAGLLRPHVVGLAERPRQGPRQHRAGAARRRPGPRLREGRRGRTSSTRPTSAASAGSSRG